MVLSKNRYITTEQYSPLHTLNNQSFFIAHQEAFCQFQHPPGLFSVQKQQGSLGPQLFTRWEGSKQKNTETPHQKTTVGGPRIQL